MKLEVRQVTEVTDSLLEAFGRLMPQLSPRLEAPSGERLRAVAANPSAALFTAESGGAVVGALTLVWYDVPSGRKAWIEDVVVDAAARGFGAGEALVRAAQAHAAAVGAGKVMLTSNPSRGAARRLYAKMGFKEAETTVFACKTEKIVKIAVIAVVVILAIALIAPAALRGKIADIVKREANAMLAARLDFEKLDISLLRHFPNASVELKGLTLVGVDRFEGDTIVAARRISVVVNLMSLFGDSGFEVTKVILASPAVHAHKLADGAVSWDVMKPSEAPAEEVPAEEPAPSSFRLSVRDFRISDAAIRYEDDSTNMRFSTAPLSLRLRGNMSADRTDLDLRLTAAAMRFVSGGIPLLSDAEAELVAVIDADLANNRFTFSRNTLRLNAISVGLDGWVELDGDAVAMDLKAGCDKVQFKDVLSLIPAFYTREFKNLTAGGELSMELWARGEMRGPALPAFELKTEVRNGSFQYSSLPKAVTDINIAARVSNPGR